MSTIPVLNLEKVDSEETFRQFLEAIFVDHDAFLLRNHHHFVKETLLWEALASWDGSKSREMDGDFCGSVTREFGHLVRGSSEKSRDVDLKRVSDALASFGEWITNHIFAALGVKQMKLQNYTIASREKHLHVLNQDWDPYTTEELTTSVDLSLVSIIPSPKNVMVQHNDGRWLALPEATSDCLLIHIGSFMQYISQGRVVSNPWRRGNNFTVYSIEPESTIVLADIVEPKNKLPFDPTKTVGHTALWNNIKLFPEVGQKYYPELVNTIAKQDTLDYYTSMFGFVETAIQLNQIASLRNLGNEAVLLSQVLVQLRNLLEKNISKDDFYRMVNIWPEAFNLFYQDGKVYINSKKNDRETYYNKLSCWLDSNDDIPMFELPKPVVKPTKKSAVRDQLKNRISKYVYKESQKEGGTALLERIRNKERANQALLDTKLHDKFLAMKLDKVYNILFTLSDPLYTLPRLKEIIVDSLQDTSNPIGGHEAEAIVRKLHDQFPKQIQLFKSNDLDVVKLNDLAYRQSNA